MSNYLKEDKNLMREYNYIKNKDYDLESLTLGSDKKIWWICSKGHTWEAGIGSRYRSGAGCPICANLKVLKGYNDLESKCPNIVKEWNYKKNKLLPDEIVYVSSKKAWWKCEKGHEWETAIINRTKENGTNCPYCSNQKILPGYNDLETINPKLANQWNYEKNGDLNPKNISAGSGKKVWWKCENGHEWEAVVSSRNSGIGCPYCSGKALLKGKNDLLSSYPRIAKEWDYEKNSERPDEVFASSDKKVWWICPKGHSYRNTINNRTSNHGCPICSKEKVTSFQEKIAFYYIKKYFPDTIDNYRIKELGKREIDIFIPSKKAGIEYDGGYYHTSPKNDIIKDEICNTLGITLYRIRDSKCCILNSTSICFYRKNKSNEDLESILVELLEKLGIINPDINIDRDLDKIYTEIDYSIKSNSLLLINPLLSKEWNYEKNGNLKPENITPNSSKKVWWICPKGHEFQASVLKRNKGQQCPYCSGHRVLKGFNDITTTNPEVLKWWDYNKNKNIRPDNVSYGSGEMIWWRCEHGHSFQRIIKSQINSNKCPICYPINKSNKKDILDRIKNISNEWDDNKNENKLTESLTNISRKYWWICINGHSFDMSILDRYKGLSCPYCSGHRVLKGFNDIATTNPKLLKEWNYEKNAKTPYELTSGSNYKAWWRCKQGHEWEAVVHSRTSGSSCPYCNSNSIKVNQYSKDGRFIKQFNSYREAGESVGISGSGIKYACNSKSLTKEFQWRLSNNNTNNIEPYINNNKCIKRVKQYDLNGNYIKTYESVRKAMDETGAKKVSEVCSGKRKTSGGYIWKYDN